MNNFLERYKNETKMPLFMKHKRVQQKLFAKPEEFIMGFT